jgi:colanic acid biosynthesis protein WcaH
VTNDLRDHAGAILDAVSDASSGLPDDVFRLVSALTPLANVDLLIQDDRSRTLLTWRDDELFGTGWHVPGGIIRYKETMAGRIRACAREELGADVIVDDVPLMVMETFAAHRTRGHHISLLFRCRLAGAPDERLRAVADPPLPGQWRWHSGPPENLLAMQLPYAPFL